MTRVLFASLLFFSITFSHKSNLEGMCPSCINPIKKIMKNKKKISMIVLLGAAYYYVTYDSPGSYVICNCFNREEVNDLLIKIFKKSTELLSTDEMVLFNKFVWFCCENASQKKQCLEEPEFAMAIFEKLRLAFRIL